MDNAIQSSAGKPSGEIRVKLVFEPDPVRTAEWVRMMLAKARARRAAREQETREAA